MSHHGASKNNETRVWLQEPGNRRRATRQSCVSHQLRRRGQASPGARERQRATRGARPEASRAKKESSSRSSDSARGQQGRPAQQGPLRKPSAHRAERLGPAGAGEGGEGGGEAGRASRGRRVAGTHSGQCALGATTQRPCSLSWVLRNSGVLWKAPDFFDCKHAGI